MLNGNFKSQFYPKLLLAIPCIYLPGSPITKCLHFDFELSSSEDLQDSQIHSVVWECTKTYTDKNIFVHQFTYTYTIITGRKQQNNFLNPCTCYTKNTSKLPGSECQAAFEIEYAKYVFSLKLKFCFLCCLIVFYEMYTLGGSQSSF